MDLITLALSKKYISQAVTEQFGAVTTGYVFATYEELVEWIKVEENRKKLQVGSNLYIYDLDVPDYWWDGEAIQPLETQKIDLTGYAKTTDVEKMIEDAIGAALGGEY